MKSLLTFTKGGVHPPEAKGQTATALDNEDAEDDVEKEDTGRLATCDAVDYDNVYAQSKRETKKCNKADKTAKNGQ